MPHGHHFLPLHWGPDGQTSNHFQPHYEMMIKLYQKDLKNSHFHFHSFKLAFMLFISADVTRQSFPSIEYMMVKLYRKYLKMIVNFHFLAVCADNHFGPTQFFRNYRVPGKGWAGRNIKITREKWVIQENQDSTNRSSSSLICHTCDY